MDAVGASLSEEFVFTDVGDTSITVELVLETQATSNTTFDFKAVENNQKSTSMSKHLVNEHPSTSNKLC